MKQYRLWSYDVWGNADDGYEVNDQINYGIVEIEEDIPSDEDIVEALRGFYLKDDITVDDVEIDGDGQSIYVHDAEDGRPICVLELIEEGQ